MFVLLPTGHDQKVYGGQWVTLFLIGLNVLAFAVTFLVSHDGRRDISDAMDAVDLVRVQFPDARVQPRSLKTLPERFRRQYASMIADSDYTGAVGDRELRAATKRLVGVVESLPSHRFGYRPAMPSALTAFTSLFVHGGLWHLLANMIFLWVIGSVIESFWEPLPYAVLYLAAGVAGIALHHLTTEDGLVPLIGASGSIAGLMGAFLVGHPKTRIHFTWIFFTWRGQGSAPAWFLLTLWIVVEIALGFFDPGSGTAHFAHVGGFFVGMVGSVIMKVTGLLTYDADSVIGVKEP
jgi:membrane associated rhomboid family serine protease